MGGSAMVSIDTNLIRVTLYAYNCTVSISPSSPFITETMASYCYLYWMVISSHNLPPSWWMTFGTQAYLRNE